MISFIQYINEMTFVKGKDVNYTADPEKIIFLAPDDIKKYQSPRGKTHGIESHSIKHLLEFNVPGYEQVAREVKNFLKGAYNNGTIKFLALYTKGGAVITDPEVIFSSAPMKAYMNTLDVVNDKFSRQEPLIPAEKKLLKSLEKLKRLYEKEIESIISQAVDIDSYRTKEALANTIRSQTVVKFKGNQTFYKEFVLDFKNNTVIILNSNSNSEETVRTMFQFDLPGTGYSQVTKNFLKKMPNVRYDNKLIPEVFKEV